MIQIKKILLLPVLLVHMIPLNAGNKVINERMALVTDKEMYVTGEIISFSSILIPPEPEIQLPSLVAYVELITPEGEMILAQKLPLRKNSCNGSMTIPLEIRTGYYYLRAYTRAMRNQNPANFSYCLLKIVNPDHSEVLNYNHSMESQAQGISLKNQPVSPVFTIRLSQETATPRVFIEVEIESNKTATEMITHTVVSVVPEHSIIEKQLAYSGQDNENADGNIHATETRGLTMAGSLINQRGPLAVNITMLGEEQNNFYPVRTDSSGRFTFLFPEKYGNQDIFISFKGEDNQAELLIDNDFCSRKIYLPSPAFSLSEEEKTYLLDATRLQKISQFFTSADPDSAASNKRHDEHNPVPFYGKPDHMFYMEDYILMNTLEDYLRELPVPVRIRRNGTRPAITIAGDQTEMLIYPPLLMIDFVPIYDARELLQLDPGKVTRFDIVTAPYLRGEMYYGGILNVLSKSNDFAGATLPAKGLFVNYQLFTPQVDLNNSTISPPPNRPDVRTTLYWNPRFGTNSTRGGSFRFLTGDMTGKFTIRVTGITNTGDKIYSERKMIISQ